ncbi:MAG: hypothetical protein ACYC05_06785 [Sulfuricella sp.]
MQGKDSDEMVRGVAPVVTHNSLDAGFSIAGLRSGRGIVSQYRLRRVQEERVGYGFAIERPATRIDHQGDQQELNNSSDRGRHGWVFNLIFE